MLDVLTFFSPAFAFVRWISARVSDLPAVSASFGEVVTEAWDIWLATFGTLLPFLLTPLVFSFVYRAVHLLLDFDS